MSLATRYTPAATIVAACISALTGVGPSIASGSHTWNGNCADFPIAPMKISSAEAVSVTSDMPPFWAMWMIVDMSNVPVALNSRMMPISSPTSPIRVVTNAFFAASAAERRSYQNPISRYDPSPTNSHAMYRKRRLSASTRASIAATNREWKA